MAVVKKTNVARTVTQRILSLKKFEKILKDKERQRSNDNKCLKCLVKRRESKYKVMRKVDADNR